MRETIKTLGTFKKEFACGDKKSKLG